MNLPIVSCAVLVSHKIVNKRAMGRQYENIMQSMLIIFFYPVIKVCLLKRVLYAITNYFLKCRKKTLSDMCGDIRHSSTAINILLYFFFVILN